MTTPTKPMSPRLALAAYGLLLVAVGAGGWYRSPWPALAGCVVFVVLAVLSSRKATP